MHRNDDPILSEEQQIKIIELAIKEYFKDVYHVKKVPSFLVEYLQSNCLALQFSDAIAKAQHEQSIKWQKLQKETTE